MSFTLTKYGSTTPGNITGNTLGTETYRPAQIGLILQILDQMTGASGFGNPWKRIQSGTDASKPAAGNAGTVYVATDTDKFYFDDGSALHALGALDIANIWAAAQSITNGSAANLTLTQSSAGTANILGSNSADTVFRIQMASSNDFDIVPATGKHVRIWSPTNSAYMTTITEAGGLQMGAPTGGDKGVGTINATGLYINGTAVVAGSPSPTVVLPFGGNATGSLTNTTIYFAPGGSAGTTTEANTKMPMADAITFTKLYVNVTTAPTAGNSYAFTLRKNGADTAITCTVSDAATTANDTAHSVAFAAGDLIDIKVVGTAGAAAANGLMQLGT